MTGSRLDGPLATVCLVPLTFRNGQQSLRSVARASGFANIRGESLTQDLAEYLRRYPMLIDAWIRYSEDKRTSEGWYLRPPRSVGRIVAHGPSHEQDYSDLATACAVFIVAELGSILDRDAAV